MCVYTDNVKGKPIVTCGQRNVVAIANQHSYVGFRVLGMSSGKRQVESIVVEKDGWEDSLKQIILVDTILEKRLKI